MHRLLPATKQSLTGLYALFSHVLYCVFVSDSNCVQSGETKTKTETKIKVKLKSHWHNLANYAIPISILKQLTNSPTCYVVGFERLWRYFLLF